MASESRQVHADWLFPGAGQSPIPNATLHIEDGRIADICQQPRAETNTATNRSSKTAIIPGLVNAHTHLEFSDLATPIEPAMPFTKWIRSVIAQRRQHERDTHAVISSGLEQLTASHTIAVGEIATDWNSGFQFHPRRSSDRIFLEVIGFQGSSIQERLASVNAFIESCDPAITARLGISPHAPYSVHPELYRELIEVACEHQLPVAVHLAETKAELEFLDRQSGEFREMHEQFGIWEPGVIASGTRPLNYLKPLAKLNRALVVHGNYLGDEAITFLAEHPQIFVVYCPRTHAFFSHSPHPWHQMKEAGVSLAIGTDSRASNPDLNLFRELQFLAEQSPEVDRSWLLDLGTIHGARALGWEVKDHFLEVGNPAVYSTVMLTDFETADPYELLFHPQSYPGTLPKL